MTDQHINPLLQKVQMPGETFRLPSGGLFYDNGELNANVTNGEVHIYPMTALDEIVMKTPDKLFSGEAVNEIIQRCIPDIVKPNELFTHDIDFLLVALRKVTFGSTIRVPYTHDCENAKSHEYSVEITEFLNLAKKIDPTMIAETFESTLSTSQTVVFRPLRFKDYVIRQQVNVEDLKSPDDLKQYMFDSTLDVIHSVDGHEDRKDILEWLEIMKAPIFDEIVKAITASSDWGCDFISNHTCCVDCGAEISINVPMNPVAFFSSR